MFTGIVTDKGQVAAVETRGDTRILIDTRYRVEALAIGASVCCNGVCLTVVTAEPLAPGDGYLSRFAVDASAETLDCTNLGDWRVGTPVNLEGALKVGDELGGHIVSGH
ncbi:MAG: riboflavin synthase, partial [Pseudomonadota bacterium]